MKNSSDHIYFVVILLATGSNAITADAVGKHAQHLRELDADGRLVLAGPFTDHPSGMLVLRGETKDEINSIMIRTRLFWAVSEAMKSGPG